VNEMFLSALLSFIISMRDRLVTTDRCSPFSSSEKMVLLPAQISNTNFIYSCTFVVRWKNMENYQKTCVKVRTC
jgi:hypothetical protein